MLCEFHAKLSDTFWRACDATAPRLEGGWGCNPRSPFAYLGRCATRGSLKFGFAPALAEPLGGRRLPDTAVRPFISSGSARFGGRAARLAVFCAQAPGVRPHTTGPTWTYLTPPDAHRRHLTLYLNLSSAKAPLMAEDQVGNELEYLAELGVKRGVSWGGRTRVPSAIPVDKGAGEFRQSLLGPMNDDLAYFAVHGRLRDEEER